MILQREHSFADTSRSSWHAIFSQSSDPQCSALWHEADLVLIMQRGRSSGDLQQVQACFPSTWLISEHFSPAARV